MSVVDLGKDHSVKVNSSGSRVIEKLTNQRKVIASNGREREREREREKGVVNVTVKFFVPRTGKKLELRVGSFFTSTNSIHQVE